MNTTAKVYSMTAFARSQQLLNSAYYQGQFSWELRSVNQRYLEINFRMNDSLRHLEIPIRDKLKQHFARGKIDVSLSIATQSAQALVINRQLLGSLNQAIGEIQQHLPEATHVNPLELLQWPGILKENSDREQQEQLDQILLEALDETISELKAHRAREGEALKSMILQRCDLIEQQLLALQPLMPEIQQSQADKLRQRLLHLQAQVDEHRLHQEVALLAQKTDVAEELDRLQVQVNEVRHVLESGQPIGRRLDFLMQELNREANTLGSKSVDVRTSQASVELKVLIEQMREQVQNIE
ncbi:YicC/YloC family endoribonuclease [Thiomicrorhabdus sp. 6S3-12]|uniref:YicC/YloC family endoribonuclease n=1 Tax=Thiomicrorhabdus sp. 6S3-12 TaxID=2819681 RepID=UPI001FB6106D|nr:YicC/YloC family endoribonuclease [Thiomicrorhabdus sp. 6S3-12]